MIKFAQISGNSMYPTYKHGSLVLVRELKSADKEEKCNVFEGDVILFSHPLVPEYDHTGYRADAYTPCMIKRITRICNTADDGYRLFVEGDNTENSTDSRYFGTIPLSSVIGRVIFPKREKEISDDNKSE